MTSAPAHYSRKRGSRARFVRKHRRKESKIQPDILSSEDMAEVDNSSAAPWRAHSTANAPEIPDLFISLPPVRDALRTVTSDEQFDVAESCLLPLSAGIEDLVYNQYGIPRLARQQHAAFLRKSLGRLPSQFVGADASRPWILFWCLNGLALLGEDLTDYRVSLLETVLSMQNESGGFGGGNGQSSHLATTYAAVLAIALVGGEELYSVIDRKAMWKWLGRLKQPDGGFQMATGGEVDVRGAYCAAVIITLLSLPIDLTPDSSAWDGGKTTLLTNLPDYVRRCQTFEGGISGQPNAEAHGAYAFCALGCLALLDSPSRVIPRYLDVPSLVAWLSARQYAPEGGFSGRTNKLVDGCYSHWVGACWPLVEASMTRKQDGRRSGHDGTAQIAPESQETNGATGPADSATASTSQRVCSFYSDAGLIRYILCCCQDLTPRGGLRDKPGRPSDAYHTCYVLSGLSSAQHYWTASQGATIAPSYTGQSSQGSANHITTLALAPDDEVRIYDEEDQLVPLHPVYTIPESCVASMKGYFASKYSF